MIEQLPSQDIMARIQKLLNLAARNNSQEEAASAAAKAQQLLAEYNLTEEAVSNAVDKDGKRAEEFISSGYYKYQRYVWTSVAELNFCLCWCQDVYVKKRAYLYQQSRHTAAGDDRGERGIREVRQTQMRLIGRKVNVTATIALVKYLLGAIERVTREHIQGSETQTRSNWAMSFRQGIATSLYRRLRDEREKLHAKEKVEQWKREQAEDAAGRAGVSTSRAVSIASFTKTEEDANMDFVMGEGWSAQKAAARAAEAEQRRQEMEAYTKWAADHPEEARKQAEQSRQKSKQRQSRRRGAAYRDDGIDTSAYYAGQDAGKSIGLDIQVDSGRRSKLG